MGLFIVTETEGTVMILPDGSIHVNRQISVSEDGIYLGMFNAPSVKTPDMDTKNFGKGAAAIASATWTPEIVAAAKKRNEEAQLAAGA